MNDNPKITATAGGSAADRSEGLTRAVRDQSFANLRPRDSATLILVDNSESVPKVLLGRRHEGHKFLPGKFVFPGGRVEITDRLMPTAAPLHAARRCAADAAGQTAEPRQGGRLRARRGARNL